MVAATEAGGKETVFMPKKATIIKKKVNKIFVPACLFIVARYVGLTVCAILKTSLTLLN